MQSWQGGETSRKGIGRSAEMVAATLGGKKVGGLERSEKRNESNPRFRKVGPRGGEKGGTKGNETNRYVTETCFGNGREVDKVRQARWGRFGELQTTEFQHFMGAGSDERERTENYGKSILSVLK